MNQKKTLRKKEGSTATTTPQFLPGRVLTWLPELHPTPHRHNGQEEEENTDVRRVGREEKRNKGGRWEKESGGERKGKREREK